MKPTSSQPFLFRVISESNGKEAGKVRCERKVLSFGEDLGEVRTGEGRKGNPPDFRTVMLDT